MFTALITFSWLSMRRFVRLATTFRAGRQSVNIIKWYWTVTINTKFKLNPLLKCVCKYAHYDDGIDLLHPSQSQCTKRHIRHRDQQMPCRLSDRQKQKQRRMELEIGHYLNQNVLYRCQNWMFQLLFNVWSKTRFLTAEFILMRSNVSL